jgi:hypothetical protein
MSWSCQIRIMSCVSCTICILDQHRIRFRRRVLHILVTWKQRCPTDLPFGGSGVSLICVQLQSSTSSTSESWLRRGQRLLSSPHPLTDYSSRVDSLYHPTRAFVQYKYALYSRYLFVPQHFVSHKIYRVQCLLEMSFTHSLHITIRHHLKPGTYTLPLY